MSGWVREEPAGVGWDFGVEGKEGGSGRSVRWKGVRGLGKKEGVREVYLEMLRSK